MGISELELVFPALFVIGINGDYVTTSYLIEELTQLLQPSGEDIVILENRKDTKFSQKVRNLKSHKTLKNLGYVKHTDDGFKITEQGKNFLLLQMKKRIFN